MKRIFFVVAILAFLLSACGAKATPTIDPAQLQASAVAAANTMVAQTQAAIPPTPVPTDTPQPSPTPLPSPTTAPLPTLSGFPTAVNPTIAVPTLAAPTSSGSTGNTGDPCNAPLPPHPAGQTVKAVLIVNNSGAQVNGSIYLSITKFGECGYRGFSLGRGSSITYTDLTTGCYSLYAWINDPKKPTTVTGGACITGGDKTTFTITNQTITAKGP